MIWKDHDDQYYSARLAEINNRLYQFVTRSNAQNAAQTDDVADLAGTGSWHAPMFRQAPVTEVHTRRGGRVLLLDQRAATTT